MATIVNPLGGLFSSPSAPTSIIAPSVDDSSVGGGGNWSGYLSGLGDLFTGIGMAVSSGIQAANMPSAPTAGSGWVYNPQTRGYYNPATGQQLTSTGSIPSQPASSGFFNSPVILLLIAVVGFLLLRKKAA